MSNSNDNALEQLAEAGAYKFTCTFLMKCLSAVVAGTAEPGRSLSIEAISDQFKARRGEWLFGAPLDLSPEQQALFNAAMQKTLSDLQQELDERLNAPQPRG